MRRVAIIGCGAYMETGYGCPGEWRCLKAAAEGEGKFDEPEQIVQFLRCNCPGRNTIGNLSVAAKLSGMKLEKIYLSSCLVNAKPGCPYFKPEELASLIQEKTGTEVIMGTHDYH
jgi:predicted metal-binding protein